MSQNNLSGQHQDEHYNGAFSEDIQHQVEFYNGAFPEENQEHINDYNRAFTEENSNPSHLWLRDGPDGTPILTAPSDVPDGTSSSGDWHEQNGVLLDWNGPAGVQLRNWPYLIPGGLDPPSGIFQHQPEASPEFQYILSNEDVINPDEDEILPEPSPTKVAVKRKAKVAAPTPPPITHKDLTVSFVMYLARGVDLTKGALSIKAKARTTYTHYKIKDSEHEFDLLNHLYIPLKTRLFSLADIVEKREGASLIFQNADATNPVTITVYITGSKTWNRRKGHELTCDADIKAFFEAVQNESDKPAGIVVSMVNPIKALAQMNAFPQNLSFDQAAIIAVNTQNKTTTTPLQIARTVPETAEKKWLKELNRHHGSRLTHGKEGLLLVDKDELTKTMKLTFEHMIIWARELANGTDDVTLDKPPVHLEGFEWTNSKRPLSATTPLTNPKRARLQDNRPVVVRYGYAEMNGIDITIDYVTLKRLARTTSLKKYLRFCHIPEQNIIELRSCLLEHGIEGFHRFLFPDVLNARDLLGFGIAWGTAMDLMAHTREYYQILVENEFSVDGSQSDEESTEDSDGEI
ncbi:uncharacterized protein MELLADRAFT_58506 [Melampsora larici-populina 98AG31]|uniref:Uncharacterized protein n=1 Tax=Melampsora larici-populina (strain 98AG31 / pathotype 3-4-7) TaxID=747676 RepID=F4R3R8_MELLP|nr:uncharacterized protein MELLADRAFT_58506 [Melampsora larici-populina 98AG31]EGG13120.1 hypothetical protein MELLADRAFT_58506 [Melampsora larici-populina 98AG31]